LKRTHWKPAFHHDTYPASDGEPGCLEKVCGVRQMPLVKWCNDDGMKPDLMMDAILLAGARGGRNKRHSRPHA